MPSTARLLLSAAAPLAALLASGCATPFRADVARFQQLPQPAGQTFYVQPADPARQGGLEFATYAGQVAQRLAQLGYRPVPTRGDAQLVVDMDYGVDNGREKIVSRPDPFWGSGFGYGGWGYGRFGYGRFGYGRFGYSPWFYGWGDPFWGGGWGSTVESYTYYTSFLDLRITRANDGTRLFEGHAKARSADDRLTVLVPNLIDALFVDFPGRSGEEVRITIPPAGKGQPRVTPRQGEQRRN